MKINKLQLLQIIRETQEMDIDEMATWKNPEARPLYDEDGKHVGFRMVTNLDNVQYVTNKQGKVVKQNIGPAVNVIFACQEDVNGFIESHQDLIQRIKEKEFPESDEFLQKDLVFTNVGCPLYRPHQRKWVDDAQTIPRKFYDENGNEIDITTRRYEVSGESLPLQEKINRDLKKILTDELMSDNDLENHLNDCSIPFFKVRVREYEDRHDIKNSNNRIHYGSDVFNLYESSNDLLRDVLNRSVGLESDVDKRETHIGRLRNEIYGHWDPKKKNEQKYEGLTEKYALEKRGFAEKNYDVNIMSRFDLLGERAGNTFNWRIKLRVTYGKKISIDKLINNINVNTFKVVEKSKEIEIDPNVLDENNYILKDAGVVNGLFELIREFKDELMSISTNDALEMARYFQFEVGDEMEVNETINKLIKTVINESGMKKKIRIKETDFNQVIINSVLKTMLTEEQYDDFITKHKENNEESELKPPNENNGQPKDEPGNENGQDSENSENLELTLGQDENGIFYIIKDGETDHPQIIAKTK